MLIRTAYKMKPPPSVRINYGHPLADKLIACWLFNEGSGVTAFDSSGRGHHGTLTGGATWTTGKYGRALDLDGTNGYIAVPDHDDFTPALHPFSISMDVYIHDAMGFPLANKGVYNEDGEWRFVVLGDDFIYNLFSDESVDNCQIGRRYDTEMSAFENQWVHLVGTADGGILSTGFRIYINGLRVDDRTIEGNPGSFVTVENLTHDVWLGRYAHTYADGVYDNVMMWRRVLTPSDITKLCVNRFCMFERKAMPIFSGV